LQIDEVGQEIIKAQDEAHLIEPALLSKTALAKVGIAPGKEPKFKCITAAFVSSTPVLGVFRNHMVQVIGSPCREVFPPRWSTGSGPGGGWKALPKSFGSASAIFPSRYSPTRLDGNSDASRPG
jgi:hypothetical protein